MRFRPSYHLAGASPLPLDVGYLFLVGSNILLSKVVQQRVVILELLQEMSAGPSTPPCCLKVCLIWYEYNHFISFAWYLLFHPCSCILFATLNLKSVSFMVGQRKDGGGVVREFGIGVYTLLYLQWITTGPAAQHSELCPVSRGSLDGRGLFWEDGYLCVCGWVPLLYSWNSVRWLYPNTNKSFKKYSVSSRNHIVGSFFNPFCHSAFWLECLTYLYLILLVKWATTQLHSSHTLAK